MSTTSSSGNTHIMNYGEADGDMELGVIPQQQLVKSGSMGSYKGARNHKVELRFKDVRVSVNISKMKTFFTGGKSGEKDILKGISGIVASGQILAIIGSSGAGKTSLLDTLVGKMKTSNGLNVTGDITVNGGPISPSFLLENAAYVPQEDRLWSALSVRENLTFACKLYHPDLAEAERESRVNTVLESLGLESCQDTKVGNIFIKGASGGQKRRTSIGVELVNQRKILFLDEPTSGLDAASAAEIMALLRRLTSDTGLMIVTSIHQPSTRVFNSFDQVILLTMGQTAYFGPASKSLEYFASQGYIPDGLVNPADFLLETTNSDFSNSEAVQRLADCWLETKANKALMAHLDSPPFAALPAQPKLTWMSRVKQLKILTYRTAINCARDPAAYAFRIILYLFMSFFLGSVYYRVENTQEDILNRIFLVLWMKGFNSFMNMASIPVFGMERNAVVKEIQNGQYNALCYCIGNAVVQVPFVFLIAFSCSTPVYWITSMNDLAERYALFVLVMFLMLFVFESMAQLIGVVVKNFIFAIALFASLLGQFFIFNGFFLSPNNIPNFWVWLYWLSPMRFAWQALAYIVFDGQTYAGYKEGDCVACYGATGEAVLETLSINGGTNLNEVNIGQWCGILTVMSVVSRTLHYFALRNSKM